MADNLCTVCFRLSFESAQINNKNFIKTDLIQILKNCSYHLILEISTLLKGRSQKMFCRKYCQRHFHKQTGSTLTQSKHNCNIRNFLHKTLYSQPLKIGLSKIFSSYENIPCITF